MLLNDRLSKEHYCFGSLIKMNSELFFLVSLWVSCQGKETDNHRDLSNLQPQNQLKEQVFFSVVYYCFMCGEGEQHLKCWQICVWGCSRCSAGCSLWSGTAGPSGCHFVPLRAAGDGGCAREGGDAAGSSQRLAEGPGREGWSNARCVWRAG